MSKTRVVPKQPQGNAGNIIHQEQRFELRIPLNSPDQLKKYADIDPKFPDRILEGFEAESKHRRERELQQDRRAHKLSQLRLWLALGGGMCVLGVGCLFMYNGFATQGASIICTVVVAFAGIFVGRSWIGKKEEG